MRGILILMFFGLAVDAQNWNWQHRQEEKRGQNMQNSRNDNRIQNSRDIYYMDDLTQRVQSLPKNSRNFVSPAESRVLLNLQLLYYKDPNRALPGNLFCYYNAPNSNNQPVGTNNTGTGGNTGPTIQNCRFMFTTLITAEPNLLQVYTAGPTQLGSDGSANLSKLAPWTKSQTLGFAIRPLTISVLVHHYGNVADQNGNLLTYSTLVHVDSFTLSLLNITPAPYGTNFNNQFAALVGIPGGLGTRLQINYGLRCNVMGQVGRNCDLICKSADSSNPSSPQVCNSTITGKSWICNGNNTYGSNPGQVTNCTYCQYGASTTGGVCQHAPSFYSSSRSSGVDHGYYVATIVLAVIAGIFLIFLLAAVLLWCWGNREESHDDRGREWSFRNRNRPDIVKTSKPSPPLGGGYHPVNTQADPEWQPARTQAGMQRNSATDSQNSSGRPPAPYYEPPGDRQLPPLATLETTGSRASEASSNTSYPNPNGPRREAAV